MSYALEITNLSKSFYGVPVLRRVNLNAETGQLVTLLGPSGCGKTTTLRLIAGFEWPDGGAIAIKGRVVASETVRVPAEERRTGMVFQEYALFPHLNVYENIAFGVQGRGKAARVAEMLALVGLEGLEKRMPYELSGGQQQRIALARALAPNPDVLLLDEPFSNLDAALRAQMRSEVRAILKRSGITCLFVTHDQEEALSIADEVAVMLAGQIAQVAPPQALYHRPASREVASFIGEAHFLRADAGGDTALCALGTLPLLEATHGPVDLLIRPEALHVSPNGSGGLTRAQVVWREFYGHDQRIGLVLEDGTPLVARTGPEQAFVGGEWVSLDVLAPLHAFAR